MDRTTFAGKPVGWPYFALLIFLWSGCADKNQPEPEQVEVAPLPNTVKPDDGLPVALFDPDTLPEILSTPLTEAFTGHPYAYQVELSRTFEDIRWELLRSPEGMRIERNILQWTPQKEGRFSISLRANAETWADLPDSLWPSQDFFLRTFRMPDAQIVPLPGKVTTGTPVTFDLGPSKYPSWAWSDLRVRYDFDGDENWDTPFLPFSGTRVHTHRYELPGTMTPRILVKYRNSEERSVSVRFLVNIPPRAVLNFPDTLEPGSEIVWDATESKGNGPLRYRLDIDGNGTWDALDSVAGKFKLAAPPAGKYTAILEVRDATGSTHRAEKRYVSNAAPGLRIKSNLQKTNLVTPVTVQIRAFDSEDDFTHLRYNLSGLENAWQEEAIPADSTGRKNRLEMEWVQTFDKPGHYVPQACVTSADGRIACAKTKLEIYDAPPVCSAGPAIRATLGQPVELKPTAEDPDGKIVKWEWDLNGDGEFEFISADSGNLRYTFAHLGEFKLTLRVTSSDGRTATSQTQVEVKKKW